MQTFKVGEEIPYIPVMFGLKASIYMTALLKTMEDAAREDVRKIIAESILDAAFDHNPYALFLTPDEDTKAPIGMALKVRAGWWDHDAKEMRLSDCPARVFGEVRSDAGAVNGFLTLPSMAKDLASWIADLGGVAEFNAPVVN